MEIPVKMSCNNRVDADSATAPETIILYADGPPGQTVGAASGSQHPLTRRGSRPLSVPERVE